MTWKKKKDEPADQQAVPAAKAGFSLGKVKKYLKWIIPLVVVAALVTALIVNRVSEASKVTVAPEYTQAAVNRRTISQTMGANGTLNPAHSYTVKTLVSGEILSCNVEEGKQVTAGEQLYQIENSDASANVEQAQINRRLPLCPVPGGRHRLHPEGQGGR